MSIKRNSKFLYLQRDYQGSIVAISDAAGQVLEKRLFDAWGNVLVQDGAGNILNGLTVLDRGYTGHEHLQSVGLIHMNGRLYDAKLHRFLQPDNYVQDPGNTQNYNRYGYVLNNPLKYIDPSGELSWKSIGRWFKRNANDIIAGVQIVGGVILTATGLPEFGVPLITAGVTHFAAAYNEYKQTGNWSQASKNAGVFFNVSFDPESFYNKDKQNGVNQNEPVVKPRTDSNNSGENGNKKPNESVYDFYGSKVFIMSQNGSNNWSLFGVIHTSRAFYDGYKANGLNSYEGLLLMHEYGHYLHAQYAPLNFYSYGMWSSIATASSSNASNNWTEVMANTMSYYYFHYPSVYNSYKKDYPINKNFLSDELKYKLYHHLKL
ncbi:RHS repeat domain-containing protein [Flavobacterium daejeonense]|uniref:RHS repeat domain-containing protein n=1 Tax=Flavobacterium daejeonense TaxID=350893 RepID=UPI00047BC255|nr:RHS repeat-associated core domain-containing protein [Flavobacterium daejeonense]